jgi:hypothetical protein
MGARSASAHDCGVYKLAWRNFLYVTQPQAGALSLLYQTIADVIGVAVTPMFAAERPPLLTPRALKASTIPTIDALGRLSGQHKQGQQLA